MNPPIGLSSMESAISQPGVERVLLARLKLKSFAALVKHKSDFFQGLFALGCFFFIGFHYLNFQKIENEISF
jgi:hypothetical protein